METRSFDVIITGAGVAGSALATLVARSGRSVLLLERERQFRDRVRGEWIAPWGIADVRRSGLFGALEEAGAVELPVLIGRTGRPHASVSPDGETAMTFYHPALQEALVAAAERAGAEVVRGARVTAVSGDPGLATFELDGGTHRVSARLIVGADGRSSLTRKALGAEERSHRRSRMLGGVRVKGLQGDPSKGYFLLHEKAGGVTSTFPQAGGYARAYAFTEAADVSAFRGPEGFRNFIAATVRLGIPEEVVADAEQAGPLAAFVTDDSWIEHPAGGGLLLVGDAAGISDPTWGMGLALAFRDARAASEALDGYEGWGKAADAYARERAQYLQTILTAEDWQSDLYFTHGPEADRRRKHVGRLMSKDASRVLDLPGLGPALDVSEEARRRFFGEDVPMAEEAVVVDGDRAA